MTPDRPRSRVPCAAIAGAALAVGILTGCGERAHTMKGLTYLDSRPRGFSTMGVGSRGETPGGGDVGAIGRRARNAFVAGRDDQVTFVGGRPRGIGVDAPAGALGGGVGGGGESSGPSVAGALAHGSVGGKSLPEPATVSALPADTGPDVAARPAPANVEEARARARSDLRSSSPHYRYEGAISAGMLRLEDAVPLLARNACNHDAAAAPAIWALGAIGGEDAARALGRALGRHHDVRLRIRIIQALGAARARGALRPLLRALGDDVALVRIEAARALGQLGDADAAPHLRRVLAEGDAVTSVRLAAASALARLGEGGGIELLERALASHSPELGVVAIRGLGAIAASRNGDGDDDERARLRMRAAQGIASSLGSPYAQIWGEALRTLARLRPWDAVRVLDALQRGAAPEVRLRARVAKAAFGGSGSRDVLEAALVDPSFELRAVAAELLGLLGDASAVGALSRALDDPKGSVRVSAAWALGAIGDPAAAPALERAGKRDQASLKRTCAWALRMLAATGARKGSPALARDSSPAKPGPESTNAYDLRTVVSGAGGRLFCVIRDPLGGVSLLREGENTAAGYRVERIVAGERGGGTVFLSKGDDALTLRVAPTPAERPAKE